MSHFCLLKSGFCQLAPIDSLHFFAKTKDYKKARSFIYKTLNRKTTQTDSFFETSIALLDSAGFNHADSAKAYFSVWRASSTHPWMIDNIKGKWFSKRWLTTANDSYRLELEFYLSLFQKRGELPFEENAHAILHNYLCDFIIRDSATHLVDSLWKWYVVPNLQSSRNELWHNKLTMAIQRQLFTCPNLSCKAIDSLYFPFIIYKTQDLSFQKIAVNLLTQKGCTTSQSIINANQAVTISEPNFASLYAQGMSYKEIGSLQKAYHHFAQAEKISAIPQQKALCYLRIAEISQLQELYKQAKDFAQLALTYDPMNPESFVFLAKLYERALYVCRPLSLIDSCAIHLLIRTNYGLAGWHELANLHLEKSNLDALLKSGKIVLNQKQNLTCFINEEVVLKK